VAGGATAYTALEQAWVEGIGSVWCTWGSNKYRGITLLSATVSALLCAGQVWVGAKAAGRTNAKSWLLQSIQQ
jgi:type IV secretory pathway TrbF-like protein